MFRWVFVILFLPLLAHASLSSWCADKTRTLILGYRPVSPIWKTVSEGTPPVISARKIPDAVTAEDIAQIRGYLEQPFLFDIDSTEFLLKHEHENSLASWRRLFGQSPGPRPIFNEIRGNLRYSLLVLQRYADRAPLDEAVTTFRALVRSLVFVSYSPDERQMCYEAMLEYAFRHPRQLAKEAMEVAQVVKKHVDFDERRFMHLGNIHNRLEPTAQAAFEELFTFVADGLGPLD